MESILWRYPFILLFVLSVASCKTYLSLFTIELDKEAGKDDDLNALLDERKAFYTSLGVRLYP